MQVQGTLFYENDQERKEIFDTEPYHYSDNPFNYMATASWSNDIRQQAVEQANQKPKQIVLVRTLEPDRLGKSRKQIAREFLTESSCNQVYHGRADDQASLQQMLHKQQ